MIRPRSLLAWALAAAVLATGSSFTAETLTYPFFGVTRIDRAETFPRPLQMHISRGTPDPDPNPCP